MTIKSSAHPLSHADEKILTQVFDPESSPETPTIIIDPSLADDVNIHDSELLKQLKNEELKAIRLVESSQQSTSAKPRSKDPASVPDPNSNHAIYEQALAILTNIITAYPSYASAYNNRAQLRRWLFSYQPDALFSSTSSSTLLPLSHSQKQNDSSNGDQHANDALSATFMDLTAAIRLATPEKPGMPVSPAQARLLEQAWTQKGAVLLGLSRWREQQKPDSLSAASSNSCSDASSVNASPPSSSSSMSREDTEPRRWDSARLEEESSRCFFMAGQYGSEAARTLAVRTNPYARLCGSIVREAMKREGVGA